MSTIQADGIRLSQDWGNIKFNDYRIDGNKVDFQDLMVVVSEKRAVAVEGEVVPMTQRVRSRNKELDILGSLLAIFTQTEAKFASDAKGTDKARVEGVTTEMVYLGCDAYRKKGGTPSTDLSWWNEDWTKQSVEGMIQSLKSMIDSRNNAAQSDMSRLQSLVDRRDESYSTATNLMTEVSETRDNAIRNF